LAPGVGEDAEAKIAANAAASRPPLAPILPLWFHSGYVDKPYYICDLTANAAPFPRFQSPRTPYFFLKKT